MGWPQLETIFIYRLKLRSTIGQSLSTFCWRNVVLFLEVQYTYVCVDVKSRGDRDECVWFWYAGCVKHGFTVWMEQSRKHLSPRHCLSDLGSYAFLTSWFLLPWSTKSLFTWVFATYSWGWQACSIFCLLAVLIVNLSWLHFCRLKLLQNSNEWVVNWLRYASQRLKTWPSTAQWIHSSCGTWQDFSHPWILYFMPRSSSKTYCMVLESVSNTRLYRASFCYMYMYLKTVTITCLHVLSLPVLT